MRRFLFYSHDGLGLGHVRRNLTIAKALGEVAPEASILVLTGAPEAERLGVSPRINVIRLPGPHRSDQRVLAAAVEIFRPEVVLVDEHPFGSGGELGPALEIVRASGGQAVLGLPDVLDDKRGIDLEWRSRGLFDRIPEIYERVLVYGQPDVFDPVGDGTFPDAVARITAFCGYIVSQPPATPAGRLGVHRRPPRVLATAGGGDDGFPLLDAFVATAADADWNATVVAGSNWPRDHRELLRTRAAAAGVSFQKFVPSLSAEFGELDALVATGGYNTLAEAAGSGVPTVCVPRSGPTGDQLVRARTFESLGLLRLLEPENLDPQRLREEVDTALAEGRRPSGPKLDLGGDRRAAHHLLEVASARPAHEAAEVDLAEDLSARLALVAAS